MPLLPVDSYIAYARALHVAPSTEERKALGDLPQFFADMQGWDRIVDAVAAAVETLPPAQRERAVILATELRGCGRFAGARRFARSTAGLFRPQQLLDWGPPPFAPTAVVVLGSSEESLRQRFDHVVRAAETDCGRCMPYENHVAVFVCWGARFALADVWPQLKHFD